MAHLVISHERIGDGLDSGLLSDEVRVRSRQG